MSELLKWIELLSQQIPVTWFALIGSFIEEIIAPIPSPIIMTGSGSIIASQHLGLWMLAVVAVIGSFGKTVASWVLYLFADKAEDLLVTKWGKYIGISHKEIEGIGQYLNKGVRDDVMVFILRAIPLMPTAPVSLLAGLIKLPLKTYLLATFAGNIIRNLFYLYLGYVSLGTLESVQGNLDSMETIGKIILTIGLGLGVVWLYRKRRQESGFSGMIAKIQRLLTRSK